LAKLLPLRSGWRKHIPKSEDVYLMMGLAYINMPNRADSAVVALSKAMDLMDRENAATETGINIQMSLAKALSIKASASADRLICTTV
jgi:hypothetical protein